MADEYSGASEADFYRRELQLLEPRVRRDPALLSTLLADEFCEYGSSGRVYGKQEAIDALQGQGSVRFSVSAFSVTKLSGAAVLVKYQAVAHRESDQSTSKSLRSSLWVLRDSRWQMLFHQGTKVVD